MKLGFRCTYAFPLGVSLHIGAGVSFDFFGLLSPWGILMLHTCVFLHELFFAHMVTLVNMWFSMLVEASLHRQASLHILCSSVGFFKQSW